MSDPWPRHARPQPGDDPRDRNEPMSYPQQPPPGWQQQPYQQPYQQRPPKKSWARRHPVLLTFLTVSTLLVLAMGGCAALLADGVSDELDKGSVASASEGDDSQEASKGEKKAGGLPEGVYRFGSTVTFGDGSTLKVGKPVKFTRDEYAAGGENFKQAVKFKVTYQNNTDEIFDPVLTTGSLSNGDVEGESIFQTGLDAPENKVLPGKTVTWWMGYGANNTKDLTLTVTMGFLDYEDVIFTNSKF